MRKRSCLARRRRRDASAPRRRADAAALSQPARRRRSAAASIRSSSRNSAGPRPVRAPPMSRASAGGSRPIRASPMPAGAITSPTLNSAVENAFAVPGGYVYITRQLMGLMNDESELAFVLGHETGHIAANHAQAREASASAQSILGVLGADSRQRRRRRLRQCRRSDAPSSVAARDAELLARPGISG